MKPPLLRYFRGRVAKKRSLQMSKIKGKNTKPEIALRKAVYAAGARFRLHPSNLPGRPDIANRRAKVAIFVDGCFWHGCPEHFKVPKTRRIFWEEKIRRNQATRHKILTSYPEDWQVIQVFECQIDDRVVTNIATTMIK